MSRYKFGFCAWYTPFPGPFALDFCGEAGYEGVQINDLGGGARAYPLKNKRLQKGYLDTAAKYAMEIQMINLWEPGLSDMMKNPLDSAKGALAQENIREGLEACREMGVKNLFIPSVMDGRINNGYELERVSEHLAEGARYARELGVTFLYESFLGYDSTMRMYEKSGGAFRLVYDTLNPMKYGFGDAVDEIQRYGTEMIHTVHIKDAAENFKDAVNIGEGAGRFYEAAAAIDKIGFSGWIVNENDYFSGELAKKHEPQARIRKDIETLRKTFVY